VERLELKSLKGQTKAEEVGAVRAVSQGKLVENLLLKTPYKFKDSYGGTPEPQTAHDAPWLHGPSLKIKVDPPLFKTPMVMAGLLLFLWAILLNIKFIISTSSYDL
jgi:hypothetical protein